MKKPSKTSKIKDLLIKKRRQELENFNDIDKKAKWYYRIQLMLGQLKKSVRVGEKNKITPRGKFVSSMAKKQIALRGIG